MVASCSEKTDQTYRAKGAEYRQWLPSREEVNVIQLKMTCLQTLSTRNEINSK